MRLPFVSVLASVLVSLAAPALAGRPSAPAKAKASPPDLRIEKADPSVAARALSAKELPKAIGAADRKALEAVVRELKADRLESAIGLFRSWSEAGPKSLWRDDAVSSALWTFREGLLSRSEKLTSLADRVRFLDERAAAIDESLTALRAALLTRKPVVVAKLAVLGPYARDARGDEKRERQISWDAVEAELHALEAKAEESKNERNSTGAAMASVEPRTSSWLQVLAALTKQANDMKLSSPKRAQTRRPGSPRFGDEV